MNRVLFWDFDGTLVYCHHLWSGSVLKVLQENSVNATLQDVRPYMAEGYPWDLKTIIPSLKERLGGSISIVNSRVYIRRSESLGYRTPAWSLYKTSHFGSGKIPSLRRYPHNLERKFKTGLEEHFSFKQLSRASPDS